MEATSLSKRPKAADSVCVPSLVSAFVNAVTEKLEDGIIAKNGDLSLFKAMLTNFEKVDFESRIVRHSRLADLISYSIADSDQPKDATNTK